MHVKTRLFDGLEADAIGLAFEITRVGQLRLHHPRLRRSDSRRRNVGIGTRRQDTDPHGNQAGNRVLLLLGHLTRKVVLCHVTNLVRHHTGQFGLRLRRQNRPGVDADESAVKRKCVNRTITQREKLECASRIAAGFDKATTEFIEVIKNQLIVDVTRFAQANLVHQTASEPILNLR